MKKGFDFLLFFCWLFPVTFSFLLIGTGKLVAVYFIFYILFRIKMKIKLKYFITLFFIVLLIIYVSFITILTGKYDFSLPYLLTLHVIEFSSGAMYFIYKIHLGKLTEGNIATYLLISGFLLSLSILVLLMIPDLRFLSEELLPQYGNIDALRITRIRGFSNGGGADHSIQLTICFVGVLFFLFRPPRLIVVVIALLVGCLLFVSSFFVARTGMLVMFLLFIISFFAFKEKLLKRTLFVVFIIYLLSLFSPFVVDTLDFFSDDSFSNKTLPWVLDAFSVFLTGDLGESNQELLTMLFLPETSLALIFGEGSYSDFGGYYYSDSGYIKMVFSFGLPITIFIFIFIFFISIKNFKSNSVLFKIFSIFAILLIFMTIKEPFIFKIGTAPILYFLFFNYFLGLKKNENSFCIT